MRVLVLDPIANEAQAERVLRALASPNRIRILTLLTNRSISVNDIAAILELPLSTAAAHIEALEEAELIHATFEPASRGLKKVCIRIADRVILKLPMAEELRSNAVEISMPVGAYSDCHVVPTCGLVSDLKGIGFVDDPASFYEPHRIDAQLVWFHQGYVEYRFPNRIPGGVRVDSLRLSMEICSEAPLSNNNWPSDITVWINGTELGTWTSPADFGGERGRLTPEWWERESTQYGLLKTWHVSENETEIDGIHLSNITVGDLSLSGAPSITVRIGIKPDAQYIGGINLFGQRFGNYPQDIIMRISYSGPGVHYPNP